MAQHRHKRETNARTGLPTLFAKMNRTALIAAPVAVMTTVAAVTLGVVTHEAPADDHLLADTSTIAPPTVPDREPVVSRSGSRAAALARGAATSAPRAERRAEKKAEAKAEAKAEKQAASAAVSQAEKKMWAETNLNLWNGSEESAAKVGLVQAGDKVVVTGRKADGRSELAVDGKSRWVTTGHLTDEKPTSLSGVGGTCANGSSVAAGIDADVTKIHQAVCARWPEITAYGTLRGDGEHSQGRAVDIMVSGERGWAVADYLRANASALGIEYLIYAQKIWSVERSGEGWRGMASRGSTTANHYDHVHVTVW